MIAHLPPLLVIIPLLSAPIIVLLRKRIFSRWIAMGAIAASTVISALLVWQTQNGPLFYSMGGWPAPKGIEYRLDAASALLAFIICTVALFATPIGTRGARAAVREGRRHYFAAAYLLALTGLLGMTVTADAFNVFVFLEISSLATYALVSMGSHRRAFIAAFNYLILGAIGGTLILIGIGLMYQMTGTLNFRDLAVRLAASHDTHTIRVAFGFLSVGLAIKLAMFPLHQWLPDAYAEAPAAVTAFLAGTATKVTYFILLRTVFQIFGRGFVYDELHLDKIFIPLSLLAMFSGALAAVFQKRLKRLLAYSSVSQVGYLTLAVGIGSEAAIEAGFMHLIAHAFAKAGLFMTTASFIHTEGSDRLDALRGAAKNQPFATILFFVGGLGLIGVPGTLGFVSKWQLVSAAIENGQTYIAFAILASSLLAIAYVWRVFETLYFPKETHTTDEKPKRLIIPLPRGGVQVAATIFLGATIVFGILGHIPSRFAHEAAAQMTQENLQAPEAIAHPHSIYANQDHDDHGSVEEAHP